MTVEGLHTLDTNVLIYAIDEEAGDKHTVAKALVRDSALGEGLLTLQVLGDFFHATTRKGYLEPIWASDCIDEWRIVFRIVSADEAVLSSAMRAVIDHGFSFWDAKLCATANKAGCTVVYSEDMQHGRRLGGVQIVNPFLS